MGKSRQFGQEKMDLVQEKKLKTVFFYFDISTFYICYTLEKFRPNIILVSTRSLVCEWVPDMGRL